MNTEFQWKKLGTIREAFHLRAGYVAEACGLTEPDYQEIEAGEAIPSSEIIEKLGEIFSVPASYFFTPPATQLDEFFTFQQEISKTVLDGDNK